VGLWRGAEGQRPRDGVVLRVAGVVSVPGGVPLRDKTLPSVVLGLDRALRMFGGVPTYALTDNEKTVSVDHVCEIAVRNPQILEVARHYGLTIATCVPADPQSKGGCARHDAARARRPGGPQSGAGG
jgi:hypothetical protein